jgi:hypothetical protein
LPRRANTSKAAILHSDRTQAERPLQRSAALLKTLAQPAILSPQSGTAPRGPMPPMPPRRPGTKPPATIHEQPPRLSPARTIAPIVPQTDPAQPDAWVNPPAPSPAVAEPPRQQAAPPAEEPSETGSNPAVAGSRTASVEAQKTPPTSTLHQPQPEGLVLYLAVLGEIRTVADLDGKAIALGAQEPAVERAIKQVFAAAGVTPIFVGDAQTDALRRLVAREVVAAPFLVGQPTELTSAVATLSRWDLRLLEIPLDLPRPR